MPHLDEPTGTNLSQFLGQPAQAISQPRQGGGGFGAGVGDPQGLIEFLTQALGAGRVTQDPQAGARRQAALTASQPFFRQPTAGQGVITQQGGVTQQLFAPEAGSRIGGSRVLGITGGFAGGSFGDQVQQLILQALRGGQGAGGFPGIELPTREQLLGPRVADINDIINQAIGRTTSRFANLGRDVTGTVPTGAVGELEERRGREVSRAGGEIDTLLAQLGFQGQALQQQTQQQQLSNFISLLASL